MAKQITAIDTATDTFSTWVNRTNELIAFANTEVVSVNSTGSYVTGDGFVNGYFGSNIFSTGILRGGNTGTNTAITIQTNTVISGTKLTIGISTSNVVINSTSFGMYTSSGSALSNFEAINFNNSSGTSVSSLGVSGLVVGYLSANQTNFTINDTVSSTNVSINTTSIGFGNTILTSSIKTLTNGTSAQEIDSFPIATYRSGKYNFSILDLSTSANAFQSSELLVIHAGDVSYVTEYAVLTTNTSVGTLGVFSSTTNATHVRLLFTPSVANTRVKASKTLITV